MTRDINDRAKDGELPNNLRDMVEPANDAARKYDENHPRVWTVKELLQNSMMRAGEKKNTRVITTGHWRLDALTGGIRPGHVWVLGADTSWGKSSWLIAMADDNMSMGAKVLIVSTEDDKTLYADRLMCRRARIPGAALRDRKLDQEQHRRIANVVAQARPDPVWLDGRGVPVEKLCKMIRASVKEHGIDVVCVDYLQEVKSERRYQDRRIEFAEIASQLRTAIKGCGVAGVITSQITVQDGKKNPDKHSIRESRDVPNAAEVVMLGYITDEVMYKKANDPKSGIVANPGDRVIKVDKAKDGEKGSASMEWDSTCACFGHWYEQEERFGPVLEHTNQYEDLGNFDSRFPEDSEFNPDNIR